MLVVITESQGNFYGRYRAYLANGDSKVFTVASEAFDLNIYDGRTVQMPPRYFIASSSELNSTIWRIESSKPNGDDTQTLSLVEYIDYIFLNDKSPYNKPVRVYPGVFPRLKENTLADSYLNISVPTPTQNAEPSADFHDHVFGRAKIDECVTSLAQQYIDRFGQTHYIIEGLLWLVQQTIAQYGWVPLAHTRMGRP